MGQYTTSLTWRKTARLGSGSSLLNGPQGAAVLRPRADYVVDAVILACRKVRA